MASGGEVDGGPTPMDQGEDDSRAGDQSQEVPTKKRKFLSRFKKFFRRRTKSREDESVTAVGTKAKSMNDFSEETDDSQDDLRLSSKKNLSMSADSVFPTKDSNMDRLNSARSMDTINNKDSFNASSSSIERSLSMDSSENELEEDFFHKKWLSVPEGKRPASPGDAGSGSDVDLDAVTSTSSLSNVAARHRIAIKQKNKRASKQFRAQARGTHSPKPASQPLAQVKEESPPKDRSPPTPAKSQTKTPEKSPRKPKEEAKAVVIIAKEDKKVEDKPAEIEKLEEKEIPVENEKPAEKEKTPEKVDKKDETKAEDTQPTGVMLRKTGKTVIVDESAAENVVKKKKVPTATLR